MFRSAGTVWSDRVSGRVKGPLRCAGCPSAGANDRAYTGGTCRDRSEELENSTVALYQSRTYPATSQITYCIEQHFVSLVRISLPDKRVSRL